MMEVQKSELADYPKGELDKTELLPYTEGQNNELSENSAYISGDSINVSIEALFNEKNATMENNIVEKNINNDNSENTNGCLIEENLPVEKNDLNNENREKPNGCLNNDDESPKISVNETKNIFEDTENNAIENNDITPVGEKDEVVYNVELDTEAIDKPTISVQDEALVKVYFNGVGININDEDNEVTKDSDVTRCEKSDEQPEIESTSNGKTAERINLSVKESQDTGTRLRIRARAPLRSNKLNSSFSVKSEPSSPSGLMFNKLYKPTGKLSLNETESRKRPRGDVTPENYTIKKALKKSRFGSVFGWLSANSEEVDCDLASPASESSTIEKKSCIIM